MVGSEEHDEPVVGFGEHDGNMIIVGSSHVVGLVVAMVRVERRGKVPTACFPGGSLAHEAVSDVTERAVGSAQSGADEVGQLATQGAVRVIHADKPSNRSVAVTIAGLHAI